MGDEAALAPGRRLFLSSWRQVFAAPVPPFSGSMKPTRRAGGAAPDAENEEGRINVMRHVICFPLRVTKIADGAGPPSPSRADSRDA